MAGGGGEIGDGRLKMGVGSWKLDIGHRTSDIGHWTLDIGHWTLKIRILCYTPPMSQRAKMPPIAHKLYAIGLALIIIFVVISWAMTAYSVAAPLVPIRENHTSAIAPEQCASCHQTDPKAPPMKHIAFPTCGYCHRFVESK